MTPLFPRIKAVVCTTGGETSHVAIVAREFNLPCIMGSEIDYDGELDGCIVNFNQEGEIFFEV
jgi:phosphoenolpyruvate-protein kinase (PTS system EI component)